MKIKKLYQMMVESEKKVNKAEAAWDKDLDNEALEQEFDRCYQESHKATEALVTEITKLIGVDKKLARVMIHSKREKLEALMRKIA